MTAKKPWYSKSIWFGLLTAVSPFVAELLNYDLGKLLSENGAEIGLVWGALAIILRLVTKDKVQLGD